MQVTELFSEKQQSVDIKMKHLKDDLYVFKAVLTIVKDGETRVAEEEGVSHLSALEDAKIDCQLPSAHYSYMYANEELLEIFRCYGFPMSLGDNDYEDENGNSPMKRFNQLKEKMYIKFDSFDEESMKNIIFLNYSGYTVVRVHDNKNMAVAQSAENMMITERQYKDFNNMVDKLIETNRFKPLCDGRGKYIHSYYDRKSHYISGKLVLTNEEFDLLMETAKKDGNSKEQFGWIDNFNFARLIKSFDFLNIKEFERTDKEIAEFEEWEYSD